MSHTTCRSKDDDDDEDDNLSLADLMSLRISTPTEKVIYQFPSRVSSLYAYGMIEYKEEYME